MRLRYLLPVGKETYVADVLRRCEYEKTCGDQKQHGRQLCFFAVVTWKQKWITLDKII